MAEEATVNPDGSTTFEENTTAGEETFEGAEDILKEEAGVDPAIYFLLGLVLLGVLYYFLRPKAEVDDTDDFFSNLDGDKFNITLPKETEEYYKVKAKCEAAGWEPGRPTETNQAPSGPQRVLQQALMKRAIADIPMVQRIQSESGGMNKLYSQSMCSAKQWRSYQAAEALVSAEVDEVRAEADELEPGWSQNIWGQAMQYYKMLQQREQMDVAKAQAPKEMTAAQKQQAADRAAAELIKAEEREKQGKKSFSNNGSMKKGFLEKGKKKK